MRISRILIVATAVLSAAAAKRASAQACNSAGASSSCSTQIATTVRLNTVAKLTISSTNTTLSAPRASDFGTDGGVNSDGPTVTVLSNGGYTLTASAPAWSGPNARPSSNLLINVNGGEYTALGQVGHSTAGTQSSGTQYVIGYKTKYQWTVDVPGTYTLAVTYTLTAP
jgi:hypothetical protein